MSNNFWKSFSIVLHVLFDEIENQQKVFTDAYNNSDDVELVNMLIEYTEIDVSATNNSAIRLASRNGHIAVVDRLLQDVTGRVDPSDANNSAIRLASQYGHIAVVDRLLQDRGVDPSADDNYAIRAASENGHIAVVDRLLQDGRVDPSADDNYAIRMASHCGHIAVVDRLLHDGTGRVDPSAYA